MWLPSHVPAGWAPYRFGHWSWVEPWGWTWVDDTSWGFAPFHYGRWAYQNARWVWSPGAVQARPVYAPALVVFVGGSGSTPAAGDGIGWFPLGPREIYSRPYTVSTAYVQRINVGHVTNINVQIIERYNPNQVAYVNRSAPQGVTFVPREVFLRSRPAGGAVLSISPAEMTRAPLMGMSAKVAPQRESIIAQPIAARGAVPQPPTGYDVASRLLAHRPGTCPSPLCTAAEGPHEQIPAGRSILWRSLACSGARKSLPSRDDCETCNAHQAEESSCAQDSPRPHPAASRRLSPRPGQPAASGQANAGRPAENCHPCPKQAAASGQANAGRPAENCHPCPKQPAANHQSRFGR